MPQENLPGSSCRMNAAEILFLRVWEKHHSGKNSTAAAMETRLQLRASSRPDPASSQFLEESGNTR